MTTVTEEPVNEFLAAEYDMMRKWGEDARRMQAETQARIARDGYDMFDGLQMTRDAAKQLESTADRDADGNIIRDENGCMLHNGRAIMIM
jgi:hypothetical protein